MNANELADLLETTESTNNKAAAMLRQFGLAESIIKQQQLEIEALKVHPLKELTNEEILCLWDWWSGEILSTDILDFADAYKRVMQGEEGLLEWHKEYVKKMNEQYPSGKAQEK